jgi:hypothetical protein
MSDWVDLSALGKVLAASILGGVGLTVLFALGLVGLSSAQGDLESAGSAASTTSVRLSRPVGLVIAVSCFSVVVLAVAVGLYFVLVD